MANEITPTEARQAMISCIDQLIAGLQRNREILASGGRLENEHWTDIAGILRENMNLLGNQDKYLSGD